MKKMTAIDPRWDEFRNRLGGPEGCNFHEETPGDLDSMTWRCDHDHRRAKKILLDMGYDIDTSIQYFNDLGGFCDCEILFNVGECGPYHWVPTKEEAQMGRVKSQSK